MLRVNTTHQDLEITTSQTAAVIDFINQSIEYEELEPNDIVMQKNLKKIDKQSFSNYKIFNSVDVRDKQSLFHKMKAYADGFFGQNEDYSEDCKIVNLTKDARILSVWFSPVIRAFISNMIG
jgi:hypothetical protein